jgi:hypothetical protein
VEHIDLFEDVALAVLVASTTVATLDVSWRSGRGARWWAKVASARDASSNGRAGSDALDTNGQDARREPVAVWIRRLVSEQARCVRHNAPATVAALRVGTPVGALRRRSTEEIRRNLEIATDLAARSRASDVIRVTDDGIIRILLIETPEDGARSYVDRISSALAANGDVAGKDVVAAWASIRPTRDLQTADRLAVARLRGASGGWLRSLAVRHGTDGEGEGSHLISADRPAESSGGGLN